MPRNIINTSKIKQYQPTQTTRTSQRQILTTEDILQAKQQKVGPRYQKNILQAQKVKLQRESTFSFTVKRFAVKFHMEKITFSILDKFKKIGEAVNVRNNINLSKSPLRNLFHGGKAYILYHFPKILKSIYSFIKMVVPYVTPVLGVFILTFSIWSLNTYSVALQVKLGNEPIAYVRSEDAFNNIQDQVASDISLSTNSEYELGEIPTISFAVVKKQEITSENEIYNTLLTKSQEYVGQSYGFYVDGQLIGTSKNENDFERIQQLMKQNYITDNKNEIISISNDLATIKDSYPKDKERSYEELLLLFTAPAKSIKYTVEKGDTADEIAQKNNISRATLQTLNKNVNLDFLSKGTELEVGRPYYEINVSSTRTITYQEVIPYQSKRTYSDDLYENTTQTKVKGVNGSYDVLAEINYVNGVETSRVVISKTKIKDSVTQQILVGTKKIAPSGKFIWPTKGGYISSGFGQRTLRGKSDYHSAIDIANAAGVEIYASDSGKIIELGWDKNGLGNYVKIDHGNGIHTIYGHCSSFKSGLKKGQMVAQGQVIAYIGRTGNTTGNHVHFGIYDNNQKKYIDPQLYVKK